MAFDAEGYRKAARAQGIPDSEIEKDIAEELGTTTQPADFAFPKKGEAEAKGADTWMMPAAVGTAIGAGAAVAPGIYKSLRDKFGSATPPARVEPVMLPEVADQPKVLTAAEQRQQLLLERERMKTEQERIKHEKFVRENTLTPEEQVLGRKFKDPADQRIAQALLAQQNKPAPTFAQGPALTSAVPSPQPDFTTTGKQPTVTMPPAGSVPAPAPTVAPVTTAPVTTPPVTPTPAIPTPASTGTPAGQVIATAPTSQAVETAVTKTEPIVKVKAPVEPTTFRADLGPGDNWLYNTAGPEKRKAILKEFNDGKPAKTYDEAQRLWNMYVESRREGFAGPEMTKEVRKERGIPPRENFGQLGKVAKVAGVAGLALTAAQMAQAAQAARKGDYSQAAEMGFNMLGLVPGMGVGFSALTHAGGLNEGEAKELAYRQKVGAGRGIAPPSAYMR
jgi:hypothetical protein